MYSDVIVDIVRWQSQRGGLAPDVSYLNPEDWKIVLQELKDVLAENEDYVEWTGVKGEPCYLLLGVPVMSTIAIRLGHLFRRLGAEEYGQMFRLGKAA